MKFSAGKLPHEPRIHRAKKKIALLGTRPRALYVFQDPPKLGAGKISVDHKARLLPKHFRKPFFLERIAIFTGAAALPHDGGAHRLASMPIPHNGGFALVGDANGRNVGRSRADFLHCLHGHAKLCGPYFTCVVLHPAGLWVKLSELLLGDALYFSLAVEQDAAVAGGAGVKRHHILRHETASFFLTSRLNARFIQAKPRGWW